jgi:hypothetical protein
MAYWGPPVYTGFFHHPGQNKFNAVREHNDLLGISLIATAGMDAFFLSEQAS